MKKILALLLLCTFCLSLIACNSVEVEYYINTNVPTFTCVTGIEVSEKEEFSSGYAYTYNCDSKKQDKLAEKYIKYLKKDCGFAVVESDDGYIGMTTLAKGNAGVIVSTFGSNNTIDVVPYKRSN